MTEQLLQLAMVLDYADEAGRNKIACLLTDVFSLSMVPESVVEHAMKLSKVIHPDESERIRIIAEVIADIRQPIQQRMSTLSKAQVREREVEKSKISVKITEMRIEIEELVKAEKFTEAGHVKQEMKELEARRDELIKENTVEPTPSAPRDDPETWQTCLTIVKCLLKSTDAKISVGGSASLAGLVPLIIIPAVKNTDPDVRNNALNALGMACVRSTSPALAQSQLQMLLIVLKLDQDVIKRTVMRVLFDVILVFGEKALTNNGAVIDEEDEANTDGAADDAQDEQATPNNDGSLTRLLSKYLQNEDAYLRTLAVEGLCKLFLLNHVTSPKLFSQLALMFFSPATADDNRLRQCLSLFFKVFAFSSTSHAMIVEESFMTTLRQVTHAGKGTPLAAIKPLVVAKFFIFHTSQTEGAGRNESEEFVHESLAIKVLNEILSCPSELETKTLCGTLSMFDLTTFSPLTISSLGVLVDSVKNILDTKANLKKLADFEKQLDAVETPEDAAEQLTEEQQVALQEATADHCAAREAEVESMRAAGTAAGAAATPARRSARGRRTGPTKTTRASRNKKIVEEEEDDDETEDEEDEDVDATEDTEDTENVEPSTPVATKPPAAAVEDEIDALLDSPLEVKKPAKKKAATKKVSGRSRPSRKAQSVLADINTEVDELLA